MGDHLIQYKAPDHYGPEAFCWTVSDYVVPKNVDGWAKESNPPTPLATRQNGFETRFTQMKARHAFPKLLTL